jgi:hypothetical protein
MPIHEIRIAAVDLITHLTQFLGNRGALAPREREGA